MNIIFQLLVCAAAGAPLEPGTLLSYSGEVAAEHEESTAKKRVEYQLLVVDRGESSLKLHWSVSEKGQGSWTWLDQFGEVEIDGRGKVIEGRHPSALFAHADGFSPVPLVMPKLAGPKAFADGVSWRAGRLRYEVRLSEDEDAAKDSWQVNVSSAIGPKQTLLVDREHGVVSDVDEIVFMGPGKKHRLKLTLVEQRRLDAAELEKAVASLNSLAALREQVGHKTQVVRTPWSDEQQEMLRSRLPEIVERSAGTPWAELSLAAAADAKLQKGIAAAVEKLRKQFVGSTAPKLNLEPATLSGAELKMEELKGKVVVLHIWEYRDEPLVEPYGQIGYVDFLHRRHKEAGVAVFGIAVDERLDQPEKRSDAVRSIRKLRSFMNIGYPIVLGGAEVLEAYGDPQRFGAELPMCVVIDKEGKVGHYHLGFYDVDQTRGLAELDEAVKEQE